MELPESVLAIGRKADRKHPESRASAVEEALAKIRKLPDRDRIVEAFLVSLAEQAVDRFRQGRNLAMRRQAGQFGGSAKVRVDQSPEVAKVEAWSLFDYCIGGTRLGSLRFGQIPSLLEAERSKVRTSSFHVQVLEALDRLGAPEEALVGDRISLKQMKKIWERAEGASGTKAA